MYIETPLLLALMACWRAARGERWRFPDQAAGHSHRIDSKVRFVDPLDTTVFDIQSDKESDEESQSPFEQPTNTEGFYNRPGGAGRYPVRIKNADDDGEQQYPPYVSYRDRRPGSEQLMSSYDGALDSQPLVVCKCGAERACLRRDRPASDVPNPCAAGKYLCCYKRPSRQNQQQQQHTEYFNEVEDERPLYVGPGSAPGQVGPFPPPRDSLSNGLFSFNQGHESGLLGPLQAGYRPFITPTLVGPEGNTGKIGPNQVLAGPQGPTGLIGPVSIIKPNRGRNEASDLLVGLNGPTGVIGPSGSDQRQDILVGPGGYTGIIGPNNGRPDVLVGPGGPTGTVGPNGLSNNRGVLVGPGGPTGVVGPRGPVNNLQRPGVLAGPGGPTGIVGPNGSSNNRGILAGPGGPTGVVGPRGPVNNLQRPGVLVGPGGPTGIVGPNGSSNNRGVLVGPGGPTGVVGPRGPVNNLQRPGVLVGPGGPTGIVGPKRPLQRPGLLFGSGGQAAARPLLVGPGGFTVQDGNGRASKREGDFNE